MAGPIEELLNYESWIEESWITILQKAGIANVYPEHSDTTKVSPYVEVQLSNIQSTGRQYILYPDRQMWAQPYDMWSAELSSTAVTYRGKNSDSMRPMLARIRIETMLFADRFSPALLPYHQIVQMKESSLTRGFNNQTNLDFSRVQSSIKFWIRPEAWPTTA